ncbi:type I restriction enzyme M protein [Actinobaculum suis]|uniref:site-specific DNA-methyltransferase (adenine-specific) n=1 Tax=Actinobaculum suis TaxID=1657 RepID=A0A1G7EY53_9ACTO|nr:class I SAM-dependent DNA methyltransferase [Actinobaculum suis]MDY5153682.1 N-6 DNA methylase [Actinobaculum suis]SDE68594.1 type I restriction enzyme M protein [Actinobaculum suis]
MSTNKFSSHVSLIWNIAEILRGDYKEHEYGDVVLPFTVLTRLDSVLVDTKQAVLDIKATSVPNKVKELQYAKATGYPFWNTSNFTLKTLLDDPDNLEQNLSYYVQAFAPAAREVMEAYNFYNVIERLDKAGLLYQVLSEFTSSKVNLHPDVVSNDQMGHIFEELIRRFSDLSNETAGEHFTPREVIKLMVNILFSPDEDIDRICTDGAMASLYDPGVGTGGMLSIAAQHVADMNETARLEVFGQELNPQTYAVAKSDIMIKGERQERIYLGNSLTDDKTAGKHFDYMLCNPPFGVNWKKYAAPIREEAERKGYQGRFGAGTPRVSDGSFLFLQHMISKMQPYDPNDPVNAPGTRIGIVFNGSPLFTGGAGQGESEIRRWILENDWLEAIIALPDQMFYNTGILTYVWVLSNRKERRRKNKVQLIDATNYFQRMRKPLGEKRKNSPRKTLPRSRVSMVRSRKPRCPRFSTPKTSPITKSQSNAPCGSASRPTLRRSRRFKNPRHSLHWPPPGRRPNQPVPRRSRLASAYKTQSSTPYRGLTLRGPTPGKWTWGWCLCCKVKCS